MTSEADTQNRLRKAASEVGDFLWRNNSGAYEDHTGRWIRYGLANDSRAVNQVFKSSDLIGITRRIMTPADVGRVFGIFTAIEVKGPKWHLIPSDKRGHAQQRFINEVRKAGGFAGFVTHPDQMKEFIL